MRFTGHILQLNRRGGEMQTLAVGMRSVNLRVRVKQVDLETKDIIINDG